MARRLLIAVDCLEVLFCVPCFQRQTQTSIYVFWNCVGIGDCWDHMATRKDSHMVLRTGKFFSHCLQLRVYKEMVIANHFAQRLLKLWVQSGSVFCVILIIITLNYMNNEFKWDQLKRPGCENSMWFCWSLPAPLRSLPCVYSAIMRWVFNLKNRIFRNFCLDFWGKSVWVLSFLFGGFF